MAGRASGEKNKRKKKAPQTKRRSRGWLIPAIAAVAICAALVVFGLTGALTGTSSSEDASSSSTTETSSSASSTPSFSTEGVALQLSELDVEEYSGSAYAEVNGGVPYFTEEEIVEEAYEEYYPLDELGRATGAAACLSTELMPTEERGDISGVEPTGWSSDVYDFVDGGYLYNRCHLIAYQLTGENANEENLITGTRYMNAGAMLDFENLVADYLESTGNHVMYRVTPVYDGDDLVATGVLMEAWSVEDDGEGVCFCVFVYNVQPGVEIDYATGDNWADGSVGEVDEDDGYAVDENQYTYVLNTSSMKIHYSWCPAVDEMSEDNKLGYNGTVEEAEAMGYEPCGICEPS